MNDRHRYRDQRPGNPAWANDLAEQLPDIDKSFQLRVLSELDFAHWQRYGDAIVKQAVPLEDTLDAAGLFAGVRQRQDTPHVHRQRIERGLGLPVEQAQFNEWRKTAPADRNPWRPDVDSLPWKLNSMPMEAGDLLTVDSLLAHGIRPDTSTNRVHLAQYITFTSANESHEALREARVDSWRDRTAPQGFAFPGDPREWAWGSEETATLSPLGERILGSRTWVEGDPASRALEADIAA